jgi:hypothetical protein
MLLFVAERRGDISQPRGGWWSGVVQPCPERKTERNAPSGVLSGRGSKALNPATVWLANFRCRFATGCWKRRPILVFLPPL